ncbi:MAG: SAM-dependent DNA methyltransferase, partial [Bacteroidetes bacterium]|nr:SAM-dependent DNA methyltransferase [Bacteroidota bacterium]
GRSSAFSKQKTKPQTKVNPYKKLFKQGATIVPRTFYFVELLQDTPFDWNDRIINIKTAEAIQPDAKAPWKGLSFCWKIESQFVFRTALSKSILPFALFKPNLVVLPITIEHSGEKNKTEIKLHSAIELMRAGYLNASKWFQNAENIWDIHRTEKNQNITALDYLNWKNKLTDQNLDAEYLVIYNASAKDANATIVQRKRIDLQFLVESKGYSFATSNDREAYYLTAILNSNITNLRMKDFQTKGLFGARDVHKKILDIFYPKFDMKSPEHIRLAELSEKAHDKTEIFLKTNPPKQELSAISLGKLRKAIKINLTEEMAEIDKLVKKIIG